MTPKILIQRLRDQPSLDPLAHGRIVENLCAHQQQLLGGGEDAPLEGPAPHAHEVELVAEVNHDLEGLVGLVVCMKR